MAKWSLHRISDTPIYLIASVALRVIVSDEIQNTAVINNVNTIIKAIKTIRHFNMIDNRLDFFICTLFLIKLS